MRSDLRRMPALAWRDRCRKMGYALAATSAVLAVSVDASAQPALSAADRARIVAEAGRLKLAKDFAFFVVIEQGSERFVQFSADNEGGVLVDFPVLVASNATRGTGPYRDDQCGPKPLDALPDETTRRSRSQTEEQRVKDALGAAHVPWVAVYCVHVTQQGIRRGFGMSIKGRLEDTEKIADLVERVFVDAYGMSELTRLRFDSDQPTARAAP